MKPKPAFQRGLFSRAAGPLRGGTLFKQVEARASEGCALSDELLGPGFALVGFDVEPQLDAPRAARWSSAGGRTLSLWRAPAGHTGWQSRELPRSLPSGWCAIVRPDRTVLHAGPAHEAGRLVDESLALLGAA